MRRLGALLSLATVLLLIGAMATNGNVYIGECPQNRFGSNSGVSICGAHPYPEGYKGLRIENTTADGTARIVMATEKYQWSLRADTDGTFVIHDDGPAGSAMNWPDTARILIEPRTGVIHLYGTVVVRGTLQYR